MRSLKSFICTVVACGGLSHGFAQDSSSSPSPSPTATPAAAVDPALPLAAPTASPAASPALDVTLPPVPSAPALPEPSGSPASLFPQGGTVPAPSPASGFQDLLQGANGQTKTVIRKSSTATSLQELQDKIAYRDAKTKAANEPKLAEELAHAWAQPTEPEFREALRAYYHHLHDRIVAINPQCMDQANNALSIVITQLNQNRLRITTADQVRAERARRP